MHTQAELVATRRLRHLLGDLAAGAPIAHSEDFLEFQFAMELVIPSILQSVSPFWKRESLDGFRFGVAQKVGPDEAEFMGLCILISDQTWTPVHIRIHLSPHSDNIRRLYCRLGESGTDDSGMIRWRYQSIHDTPLLENVMRRFGTLSWSYTVTYEPHPG